MTFTFKTFLIEQLLLEAKRKKAVSNDDKGKLHELLLAHHLSADKEEEKRLPSHFRATSENAKAAGYAGTPEEVHNRLREKVGEEEYSKINEHAKTSAEALKKKWEGEGLMRKGWEIGDIHWTSNPDKKKKAGDHEKLTKVKDVNSTADLITTFHDKDGNIVHRRGISAKYGTEKEPNFKNLGQKSLEEMTGLREGRIDEIMKPHHQLMENLGYKGTLEQRKRQYKVDALVGEHGLDHIRNIIQTADKAKKNLAAKKAVSEEDQNLLKEHEKELPYMKEFLDAHDTHPDKEEFINVAKERAEMAEKSKTQHLHIVANELQNALMDRIGQRENYDPKQVGKQLWEMTRNIISPKTVIPHDVVHTLVKPDGKAEPIVKNQSRIADDHLHQFENLHVANDVRSGIVIRGDHKATGKRRNALTLGLKTQSGPFTSLVSTTKLA